MSKISNVPMTERSDLCVEYLYTIKTASNACACARHPHMCTTSSHVHSMHHICAQHPHMCTACTTYVHNILTCAQHPHMCTASTTCARHPHMCTASSHVHSMHHPYVHKHPHMCTASTHVHNILTCAQYPPHLYRNPHLMHKSIATTFVGFSTFPHSCCTCINHHICATASTHCAQHPLMLHSMIPLMHAHASTHVHSILTCAQHPLRAQDAQQAFTYVHMHPHMGATACTTN